MPLSASTLSGLIQSNLHAVGANGSNLSKFCSGVAAGIVMSIVGKPFTTSDTGLVPGAGTGIGTGITGLSASAMKGIALSDMSTRGSNADKMMQAIMNAVVSHLSSSATLTTTNTPVFVGTGTVNVGSIAVISAEMGANIDAQLASLGAKGNNRTKLSNAIGDGVCTNILSSGSGTVTITGSGSPTPSPGSGSGIGIVS